jgi:transposase InsO family protein
MAESLNGEIGSPMSASSASSSSAGSTTTSLSSSQVAIVDLLTAMQGISLAAPYLQALTSAQQWFEFVDAYEAFTARGGHRHPLLCISREVIEALSVEIPQFAELTIHSPPSSVFKLVARVFAPSSALAAFDRLASFEMRAPRSAEHLLENLRSFINLLDREFRMWDLTEWAPSYKAEDRIVQVFVSKLRPSRLQARVEFHKPTTFVEAKRLAITEATRMVEILREAAEIQASLVGSARLSSAGSSFSSSFRASSAAKTPVATRTASSASSSSSQLSSSSAAQAKSTVAVPSSSLFSPTPSVSTPLYTCHNCGQVGHKRPQCPQLRSAESKSSGWRRTADGRLEKDSSSQSTASAKPSSSSGSKPAGASAKSLAGADTEPSNVSGLPRLTVSLTSSFGAPSSIPVTALLDTGATHCFISPVVLDRLEEAGLSVPLRSTSLSVAVAGGLSASADSVVDLVVKLTSATGRSISIPLSAYVWSSRNEAEELILAYPFLQQHELLSLLLPDFPIPDRDALDQDPGADPGDLFAFPRAGEDRSGPSETSRPFVSVSSEGVFSAALSERTSALLARFPTLFQDLPSEPARVPPLHISLRPGVRPRAVPPRRTSAKVAEFVEKEIEDLRRRGIIEASTASFCSPIVVVPKGPSYRLCIDFRAVNEAIEPLQYPLPNTRQLLEKLSGKRVYAIMDLRSGFHQVGIDLESRPVTAFAAAGGLWQWCRVPFGLSVSPTYFQMVMNDVLSDLIQSGVCVIYIDDLCVFGDTEEEYLRNLEKVLSRLSERNFRLKREKCLFDLAKVKFLGFLCSREGVEVTDDRRQGLRDLPVPTSARQVRSFLGVVNFLRDFVPNFAVVTKPLARLTSSRQHFEWTPEAQSAFDNIRSAILKAPILYHMRPDLRTILRTDASSLGVGAVLLQVDSEGKECPVCYVSQAFDEVKGRWSTIEQELYAVFFAVTRLSPYLLGLPEFTIQTDHRNLCHLDKAQTPKIVRWRLALSEYRFVVEHIPGSRNVEADALSRCFSVRVPDAAHTSWLADVHNGVVGHNGVSRMLSLLRQQGRVWPQMRDHVRRYVRKCWVCQKTRAKRQADAVPVGTTMVSSPWDTLAIDAVGPLPEDEVGCRYILVAVDCFTRFVELKACSSASADEAAVFLLELFGRYGAPRFLRSDRGAQFVAAVIQQLLSFAGVGRKLSLAYRPSENGLVERANGEVVRHLRALTLENRGALRWSMFLPLAQRIINASPNSSTGLAPARLLFGDRLSLDRVVLKDAPQATEEGEEGQLPLSDPHSYVRNLTEVQDRLVQAAQVQQQRVLEERPQPEGPAPSFAVGQLVLVSYPERPPTKLMPKWRGPLKILELLPAKCQARCQDLSSGAVSVFHWSVLVPYEEDDSIPATEVAGRDHEEYVVSEIVAHRGPKSGRPKSKMFFLVRWAGFSDSESTWEPYSHVAKTEALDRYLSSCPDLRL